MFTFEKFYELYHMICPRADIEELFKEVWVDKSYSKSWNVYIMKIEMNKYSTFVRWIEDTFIYQQTDFMQYLFLFSSKCKSTALYPVSVTTFDVVDLGTSPFSLCHNWLSSSMR